jgi:hypothetical protein
MLLFALKVSFTSQPFSVLLSTTEFPILSAKKIFVIALVSVMLNAVSLGYSIGSVRCKINNPTTTMTIMATMIINNVFLVFAFIKNILIICKIKKLIANIQMCVCATK